MPSAARWTEQEIDEMRLLAKDHCMSVVADKLHRPQTSVRVKAKSLGIEFAKSSNHWTASDTDQLLALWGTTSVDSLADKLGKSRSGVYSKAKLLGLPEAAYKKPSLLKTIHRLCSTCKNANDRPAPAMKCSSCFKGPRKPTGTGWASRRCKNCNQGYKGKTRDFCERSCKTEYNTKQRMTVLGFSDEMKLCKKCNEAKVIWKFNLDSSRKDKVHPYCRECQKDSKALTAINARNRRLLTFYGITLSEYNDLLASQDGHCAMCPAAPQPEKNLAVDHDHISGAVRGLLCLPCNKYKLGQLTIEDVDRIYNYLHNPPADTFFGQRRFVPTGMEKPKKSRKRRSKKS